MLASSYSRHSLAITYSTSPLPYPWPWLKWEILSVTNQPEERYQINSPHIDYE